MEYYFNVGICNSKGKVKKTYCENYYVSNSYIKSSSEKCHNKFIDFVNYGAIFGISEGIGDRSIAAKAAYIAMSNIPECYQKMQFFDDIEEVCFKDYIMELNNEVVKLSASEGKKIGLSIALLGIHNNKVISVNVGNSRVYRFREGRLTQISRDHTQRNLIMNSGRIFPDENTREKEYNKLTQFIGCVEDGSKLKPNISVLEDIEFGDMYLLCSDGLYNMVDKDEIARVMSSGADEKTIADILTQKAYLNGGKDNITVIAVKIKSTKEIKKPVNNKLKYIAAIFLLIAFLGTMITFFSKDIGGFFADVINPIFTKAVSKTIPSSYSDQDYQIYLEKQKKIIDKVTNDAEDPDHLIQSSRIPQLKLGNPNNEQMMNLNNGGFTLLLDDETYHISGKKNFLSKTIFVSEKAMNISNLSDVSIKFLNGEINPSFPEEKVVYFIDENNNISNWSSMTEMVATVSNNKAKSLLLYKNKLYYISFSDGTINSMSLSGKDIEEITKSKVKEFIIVEDFIFAINEENQIFRCNLNGGEIHLLSDKAEENLNFWDNNLYFIGTDKKIYSLNINYYNSLNLCYDMVASNLIVFDNKMYYCAENNIYMKNLNTGKTVKLQPETEKVDCKQINVNGRYLFYNDSKNQVFRIDTTDFKTNKISE
jgi:Serine/threonine protein phosphatase